MFNDLSMEIFVATGAVSTQALPPIIPLAYLDREPDPDTWQTIPQENAPPITPGELQTVEQTLVCGASLAPAIQAWANDQASAPSPPAMPVPLAGIFLGAADAAAGTPDGVSPPPRMPDRIRVVNLVFMEISTAAGTQWWTELDWTVRWSKRLKLRGDD
jgi:hypothetical protein